MKNYLKDKNYRFFILEENHIDYLRYYIPEINNYDYSFSGFWGNFKILYIPLNEIQLIDKIIELLNEDRYNYLEFWIEIFDIEKDREEFFNDLGEYYRNSNISFLRILKSEIIDLESRKIKNENYSIKIGSSYHERENLYNWIMNYLESKYDISEFIDQ